jgi:hypothetical protein
VLLADNSRIWPVGQTRAAGQLHCHGLHFNAIEPVVAVEPVDGAVVSEVGADERPERRMSPVEGLDRFGGCDVADLGGPNPVRSALGTGRPPPGGSEKLRLSGVHKPVDHSVSAKGVAG